MKYALDKTTKQRNKPQQGLIADCRVCGSEMISKCGEIRVHHWAHQRKTDCDLWWEPETEWHRNWKDKFPEEWQETIRFDAITGEKHIADIYNPHLDLVIEFQNSPIDIREMQSREKFYKKMIWVVNARKFAFTKLPLDNWQQQKYMIKLLRKELANGSMVSSPVIRKYLDDLEYCKKENKKKEASTSYIQYYWGRRRKAWDEAQRPVFFDLGNELMWLKSFYIAKGVDLKQFFDKYAQPSDQINS